MSTFSDFELPTMRTLGKIAGSIAGSILVYNVGKYMKFRITESFHKKYNHFTNSHDVVECVDLNNKVCIITGANSGIGKETAKQLYLSGCVVIMACRNEEKAKEARDDILKADGGRNGDKLIIMKLDLGDLQSVDVFVDTFTNNKLINDRLDYLINNAGVMAFAQFTKTQKEEIETQFGVNHVAHFYLTNKLLPILKRNKTRIINLSSIGHSRGKAAIMRTMIDGNECGPTADLVPYDAWVYYGISKASNILFTRQLNRLYHDDGITALCVHPGGIMTNLGRNVKFNLWITLYLLFRYPYFKTIPQGAATTLRCVTISDEEIYKNKMDDVDNMHLYFYDCRGQNDKLSPDFRDNKNADIDVALWKYTENIIKRFQYLSLIE